MSDAYADKIVKSLMARAAGEMEKIGVEIEADIRDRVGEAYPPASSPGSPPHKRTGGYQEGFEHAVDTSHEADEVALTVSNPSPLSVWLERGTSRGLEPRPHFKPTFDDWKGRVPERVQTAIDAKSSPASTN